MLNFDPQTGFSVTEVVDLREEIASDWQEAFKENGKPLLNTDPETPQGQIIDSQVRAVNQKDAEILYVAQQFDPRTAEGRFQDALAKIYLITRQPAIKSSAVCHLVGLAGTQIAAGALIESTEDATQWTLNEDVTLDGNGEADVTFTCQTEGAIEAPAGTLTKIITTTAGWDSCINENAALVGQLEESQSAFESRRYLSVANNSRSAPASVYGRVAILPNVIAVYVTDNRLNVAKQVDDYTLTPHSIFVAVLGGDDDAIAKAIYESVSAGCDFNGNTTISVRDDYTKAINDIKFYRPVTYDLYVKVTLQDNASLPDGYEDIVKTAVFNNFYGLDTTTKINGESLLRLKMNDDVYSSRFTPSILNTGIANVLTVELSTDSLTWVNQVHIPITANPALLRDNITVEVLSDE